MPMVKTFAFALVLALTATLLLTADAQTLSISTVNLSAERDRVQITAQGEIAELRLEVINPAGEVVFDSGPVSAPSLEWPLLDSHGERVADGVYLCTISYWSTSGKLRKRIEQVTVSSQAQSSVGGILAAPTPETITGGGTTNQLTKFTGTYTIGDSVISESGGKIGIATTAPSATLHVNGFQPATSASNGTVAPTLLQTSGGKGGNTTTAGHTAGAGASISLLAGNGGDAVAGSTRGSGGSITLQPGGAGGGLGSGGATGNVLIAPTAGNVGVGTITPASKLTVAGIIQSTTGGFKFPNGTVQTTAAVSGLSSVAHTSTLTGSGTAGSPLGVAVPLMLSSSTASATLTASNTNGDGVDGSGYTGVSGTSPVSGGNGVVGEADTGADAFGVWGKSSTGNGVVGETFASSGVAGLFNNNSGPGTQGVAVRGLSASGSVSDINPNGNFDDAAGEFAGPTGVIGAASTDATDGIGVIGLAQGINGFGLYGYATSTGPNAFSFGVYGVTDSSSPNSYAGYFVGNVNVNGTLTSAVKDFKIDHPLDPANKYLYHTSVESPDMMNIYNGNVTTDAQGQATVQLPGYFQALNRDFRYQLTVIGEFAQAIVASEIKDNQFTIRTDKPNVKVSWQVTGIRQDAYANAHRTVVEVEKPERERGTYLHPELYGQPAEKSVEWAHHPEQMRRMRAAAREKQPASKPAPSKQ